MLLLQSKIAYFCMFLAKLKKISVLADNLLPLAIYPHYLMPCGSVINLNGTLIASCRLSKCFVNKLIVDSW